MGHLSIRLVLFSLALFGASFFLARQYLGSKFFQKTIEIQQFPARDSATVQNQETSAKESDEKEDEKNKKIESILKKESSSQNEKMQTARDDILDGVSIINRLMKGGFEKKATRSIDTIVVHASYDALGTDPHSVEGVIKEYEINNVSAHYLIDRSGKIYQLVKDNNVAWHAGVSKMPDGRTNVNQFSLGIELLYTKKEEPNSEQYSALKKLIASFKEKYTIKSIVGHNQIAPDRKDDPWNFDWGKISNH